MSSEPQPQPEDKTVSTEVRPEDPAFSLAQYARMVTEAQQSAAYRKELDEVRAKYFAIILERDRLQAEVISLQEKIRTARDLLPSI